MDSPSHYHSPAPGSWRDILRAARLAASYKVYRRLYCSFVEMPVDRRPRVLDLGAGPGYLSSQMERWPFSPRVVAVDVDWRLLREAQPRMASPWTACSRAEVLPFPSGSFDLVVSLHVIEHVYEPEKMLGEINRILSRDGVLILATPNPGGLAARLLQSRWQGRRDDHVSLREPSAWGAALTRCGFEPLRQHTTFLSGFRAFRVLPLALFNWGALFLFGSFRWSLGEAYLAVWRKRLVGPRPGSERFNHRRDTTQGPV